MSRRSTVLLLCGLLSLTLPTPHNPGTVSASDLRAQPDPTGLLVHADRAMQSLHSLHTAGRHTSNDRSARLDVTIVGSCTSAESSGLPLKDRTWVHGSYAAAGKPVRQVDTHYILTGQVSPPAGQAWKRSASTHGAWIRGPFDAMANGAYAEQLCPALIRATYIHGYLSGAGRPPQRVNLGLQTIGGHSTWHVRQILGYTIDFFIDAQSYYVRRLVLSGNLGTTWQQTFDYSRFNMPVPVRVPATGRR